LTFSDFSRRRGLALAGVLMSMPTLASAQVIEIDPGGGVTTYNGPAAVHADGSVVFLHPSRARSERSSAPDPDGADLRMHAAAAANLSPDLIEAVAWNESRLHPRVVSAAGAVGEMQLMPATAHALGVDAHDSQQNYRGGATYLRWLMQRYDGNLLWALAAYNAGPGAVEKYHGVPPYKETQAYVAAVLDRLSAHAATLASNRAGR
jgi:soluble lytic murein transglycosylase-like protein